MKKLQNNFNRAVYLLCLFALLLSGNAFGTASNSFDPETINWTMDSMPDAWRNYSAIITHREQSVVYNYEKNDHFTFESEFIEQVLVRDQAAIANYAEFSIARDLGSNNTAITSNNAFSVFVQDTEGNIEEYSEVDAIKVDEYQQGELISTYKLSIPGLSIGDRITYHVWKKFSIKSIYLALNSIERAGFTEFADEELPVFHSVVKYQWSDQVIPAFYFLNGAPQMEPVSGTVKLALKEIYKTEMWKLNPSRDTWWADFDQKNPTIYSQFRLGEPNLSSEASMAFMENKPSEYIDTVSQNMMVRCFRNYWKRSVSRKYSSSKMAWENFSRKRYGKEVVSNEQKAREAYYFLRHREYFKDFERNEFHRKASDRSLSNKEFAEIYSTILENLGIQYDIAIASASTFLEVDQIANKEDIVFFLRVNFPNDTLWAFNFNMVSVLGGIPSRFDHRNVYLIDKDEPGTTVELRKKMVDRFDHNESKMSHQLNLNWSATNVGLAEVDQTNTYSGHLKAFYQFVGVNHFEVLPEELDRFNTKGAQKTLSKKRYALTKKFLDERRREEESLRLQFFELDRKEEFDGLDLTYESFQLIQDGRWHDKPELIFKEQYQIDGLLTPIGDDYVFEAGRLIGDQIALHPWEKKRKAEDIYMSCPRSYSYSISVTIPAGYHVEGVEALNTLVENETGGFSSTAKVEKGKLVIETNKYYLHRHEKMEDWPQIVDFLTKAYTFSQMRVLFVKD